MELVALKEERLEFLLSLLCENTVRKRLYTRNPRNQKDGFLREPNWLVHGKPWSWPFQCSYPWEIICCLSRSSWYFVILVEAKTSTILQTFKRIKDFLGINNIQSIVPVTMDNTVSYIRLKGTQSLLRMIKAYINIFKQTKP